MSADALTWKELLTFGLAAIGAVLGVINTWTGLRKDRVRLKVIPALTRRVQGGLISSPSNIGMLPDAQYLRIEVINLSGFPVTIDEVGLTRQFWRVNGDRMAVPQPLLFDNRPWPRRLEARDALQAYVELGQLIGRTDFTRAYASTACGRMRFGSSPVLRKLRRIGSTLR
jgi:hypothetical protein